MAHRRGQAFHVTGMEGSSYTQPPAEKQPSVETSSSSSATDRQGFLHSVYPSSGADDNATIGTHAAHCSNSKHSSGSNRKAAIPQQEGKAPEHRHLNFCANNCSKAETVGRPSVSRPPVPEISRHGGGHRTSEASNASSSSCESRAVANKADYFLQAVKAAQLHKTTEPEFTRDGPRTATASNAGTGSSEQNTGNFGIHSECGTATAAAVRRRTVDAPDRFSARNAFLFLQYIPHSPVTVHLLPCRISFTGTAPVRRYFRPWRLPTPSHTHVAKIRRQVISSAELPKEAGDKVKRANTGAQSTQVKPVLDNDMKNAVNSLEFAKKLPSPNPECQASPSRLDTHTNRDEHLSSCFEGPVDNIDEMPEDTSPPQLFEALLHGRLLRGVSLPFKQGSHSSRKNQHRQYNAETERGADSPFTEDVQAYIVMRKSVTSDHGEGHTPVMTSAHTVKKSMLADLDADRKSRCEQTLAGAAPAHASVERKRGFLGIAEFVPLARVKQLCYWNHDTMPTPLDDVPQALAFMQLARIVHSMNDD